MVVIVVLVCLVAARGRRPHLDGGRGVVHDPRRARHRGDGIGARVDRDHVRPHAARQSRARGARPRPRRWSARSTPAAMLAQGLSGFTLPTAPLLLLQAVAMGLLLLVPLYVPRTAPDGTRTAATARAGPPGPGRRRVHAGGALPLLFVLALRRQDDLTVGARAVHRRADRPARPVDGPPAPGRRTRPAASTGSSPRPPTSAGACSPT